MTPIRVANAPCVRPSSRLACPIRLPTAARSSYAPKALISQASPNMGTPDSQLPRTRALDRPIMLAGASGAKHPPGFGSASERSAHRLHSTCPGEAASVSPIDSIVGAMCGRRCPLVRVDAEVVGQLELGLRLPRDAEAVVHRLLADRQLASLLEPERLVEGERPLGIRDAVAGVDQLQVESLAGVWVPEPRCVLSPVASKT